MKNKLIANTIALLCDGDKNSSFRKYFTMEMLEKFAGINCNACETYQNEKVASSCEGHR